MGTALARRMVSWRRCAGPMPLQRGWASLSCPNGGSHRDRSGHRPHGSADRANTQWSRSGHHVVRSDLLAGTSGPGRTRPKRHGSSPVAGPRSGRARFGGGGTSLVAAGDTALESGTAAQSYCGRRVRSKRRRTCAARARSVRNPGWRANRIGPGAPLRRQPRTNLPRAEAAARYGACGVLAGCPTSSCKAYGDARRGGRVRGR